MGIGLFPLLWIILPWTFIYNYLYGQVSISFGYTLLDHLITLFNIWETARLFQSSCTMSHSYQECVKSSSPTLYDLSFMSFWHREPSQRVWSGASLWDSPLHSVLCDSGARPCKLFFFLSAGTRWIFSGEGTQEEGTSLPDSGLPFLPTPNGQAASGMWKTHYDSAHLSAILAGTPAGQFPAH